MFRYGQTGECFVYRLIVSQSIDQLLSEQQIKKIKISNSVIDKILNSPYNEFEIIKELKELCLPKYFDNNTPQYTCVADTVLNNVLKHAFLCNRVRCFNRNDLLAGKRLPTLSAREKQAINCVKVDDDGGYKTHKPGISSNTHTTAETKQGKRTEQTYGFNANIKELIAMRILCEYPHVPDDIGQRLLENYLKEFECAITERNDMRLYNEMIVMNRICKYHTITFERDKFVNRNGFHLNLCRQATILCVCVYFYMRST